MDKKYCNTHGRYYYYQCPECMKESPKIDTEKLKHDAAEKRKRKQQHAENTQKWIDEVTGVKYEGAWEVCPDCGHRSLLYNETREKSHCHNLECPTNVRSFGERL